MPYPLGYVNDGDWDTVRRNTGQTSTLLNPPVPQARVFNNANIATATATLKVLTFNSERYDNGDLHSTTSNTSRLTAPITGLYRTGGCVVFDANTTGGRIASIRLNGTTTIGEIATAANPTAGQGTTLNPHAEWQMTAGDYVELTVIQGSGGALNILTLGNYSPEFWMHRVSGYVNQGV